MKFVSTNKQSPAVSFKKALVSGMPEDNGLYMPEQIPKLPVEFIDQIGSLSYSEIGYEIAKSFIEDEIPPETLQQIVEETLSFELPIVKVSETISTLELFHGPTMAFKDVGARFMARCLGYFTKNNEHETTVLVATSGDTGSAVAHGFYGVNGIKVVILYPSGKISDFQEKQMTTLGKNIIALEVDGTFDDCQRLVKSAFSEDSIRDNTTLTSANSINIARLIPQIFYYFIGLSRQDTRDITISVPSGNYGNLTAGLIAKRMGLPIKKFVASSNMNDIIPQYLQSGDFNPRPSIQTISNAMDVGNPSNFARMLYLYDGSYDAMSSDIDGYFFTDSETRNTIWKVRDKYDYILDPHGAIGYLGLKKALESQEDGAKGIFLETAHPSKFREVVEPVLEEKVNYPKDYELEAGPKLASPIKNDLQQLKEVLLG